MANWYTVSDSKVVWAPIGMRRTKTGELKPRFSRIGTRVTMADGSWWFYSFRHGSWTQHFKPVQAMDRLGRPATEAGTPVMLPERKNSYKSWAVVEREFGGRAPGLLAALQTAATAAVEAAETDE
jgi:hypothetical protein